MRASAMRESGIDKDIASVAIRGVVRSTDLQIRVVNVSELSKVSG